MSERDDAPAPHTVSVKRARSRKRPTVLVRFTASDGVEWTTYDLTWSKGRYHRRPHGDMTATHRAFVSAAGVKRAYQFDKNEGRVFEPQALERQLKASMFLPTHRADPDEGRLGPGERRTPTFDGNASAPSTDDKGLHGLSDAPGG
jgi:hypothetical protein